MMPPSSHGSMGLSSLRMNGASARTMRTPFRGFGHARPRRGSIAMGRPVHDALTAPCSRSRAGTALRGVTARSSERPVRRPPDSVAHVRARGPPSPSPRQREPKVCAGGRAPSGQPSDDAEVSMPTPSRTCNVSLAGTPDALPRHMEPLSPLDRARLLRDASSHLVRTAREHVASARQKLDRARNMIQVVWLLRELQRRRRQRGGK
jgi:hypothetical protein